MKKTTNSFLFVFLFVTFFSVIVQGQSTDFFDRVNYKGAFGSTNWLKGWTALDSYGYLVPNKALDQTNTVTVTDASINAGDVVYWTADKTYL